MLVSDREVRSCLRRGFVEPNLLQESRIVRPCLAAEAEEDDDQNAGYSAIPVREGCADFERVVCDVRKLMKGVTAMRVKNCNTAHIGMYVRPT